MASAFEAEFTDSALPELFETFGHDAVYVPPAGASTTGFKARLLEEQTRAREENGRLTQEVLVEIRVQVSDLARPMVNGRFEIDGRGSFTVEHEPYQKNGMWICKDCRRLGDQRLNARRVGSGA